MKTFDRVRKYFADEPFDTENFEFLSDVTILKSVFLLRYLDNLT